VTPTEGSGGPAIDTLLLQGFDFACRPGCGLCCYATPAASPAEQQRLLQLDPKVKFVGGSGGFRLVPARAEGGACRFLARERCTVHDARPFPCREYPLSIHIGARWQASLVLTCPGVTASDISRWAGSGVPPGSATGIAAELEAVQREADSADAAVFQGAARRWHRALRSEGIEAAPAGLDRLRSEVADQGTFPRDNDLRGLELPYASEGLALLPLFFDPRFGRVALGASGKGVELLQLRETGGTQEVLAQFPPPARLPRLAPEARTALEGYLAYVLRRDAFVGSVLEDGGDAPLADRLAGALRSVGIDTIARAVWRAQLAGGDGGHLRLAELWDGIRATDADLLDRPTVGAFL
jgi:Fe-S-cluster containining protein